MTVNPIIWRETLRERRHQSRWLWVWRLAALVGLLMVLVLLTESLNDPDAPTREAAIQFVWLVNAAVAIRAIWAGASVASREFTSPTWESLLLTGIGVRRLYIGNWRAALRIAAPWMFALGVVRLAMLPLSMMGITTRFAGFIVSNYGPPGIYPYPEALVFFSWIPWAAVVAVISAVALTVLEALLCTALGVTLAFLTRNNIAAILLACVLRLMPLVVSTMEALLDGSLDFRNPYAIFTHSAMSMADLGTSAISRLAAPYMAWSTTTHIAALYGLLLAYMLGLTLLVSAVVGGLLAIRWSGARSLPERFGPVRTFRLAR